MTRYIIETASGALSGGALRTIGDADTLIDAHTQCAIAMSVAPPEGPSFAFARDEAGHFCVALERTADGRILDHIKGR